MPILIGERRKSGSGNRYVIETRKAALDCHTSFSIPDRSTPYRVFVFITGKLKKGQEILNILVPKDKTGLCCDERRVFLASETSYVILDLFHRILKEFIKWRKGTFITLYYNIIRLTLRVDTNKEVIE